MSDVNPRWHSTGDEGYPLDGLHADESAPAARRIPISGGSVSRLPSALLGILIVIGIGFFYFRGTDLLPHGFPFLGQAVPPDTLESVQIHITDNGFDPASATVQPGQTIVWTNDQDVPHILQSETVKDGSGDYLYSPAIFPGSTYSFVLSTDMTEGSFEYTSLTSADLKGTLVIGMNDGSSSSDEGDSLSSAPEETSSASSDSSSFPSLSLSSSEEAATSSASKPIVPPVAPPVFTISSSSSVASQAPSSESVEQQTVEAIIPFNPYTVGTAPLAATATTTPPQSASTRTSSSSSAGNVVHHAATKTLNQSGPELWCSVLGSLVIVAWIGRRMLSAERVS